MAAKGEDRGDPIKSRKGTSELQAGEYADDAKSKRHGNHNGPQRASHLLHLMESGVRSLVPQISTMAGRMALRRDTRSKIGARVLALSMAGPSQN